MYRTKILIVEDEVLIADFIEEILKDHNFSNTKIANNYSDAEIEMQRWTPEVILMDINLNDALTGIELSHIRNEEASVIFLTGQFDKASMQKAFITNPESYLTKPIKKHDLVAAIKLCVLKKQSNAFKFKDGYDDVSLDYNKILYLNADGNYLHIHTTNKKYTIRLTLAVALESLPNHTFKQIHRSFIVNSNKVTRKSNGKIFLNDIVLPISRKHDKAFKITD